MYSAAVVPYVGVTELIRAGANLLNLPTKAICTALVLCHRLRRSATRDFDVRDERLAATCLFIGSKVEEAALRTNDLLNVIHYLSQHSTFSWSSHTKQRADHSEHNQTTNKNSTVLNLTLNMPGCDFLVGDSYYAAKAQLIADEQLLLRLLHFNIYVEQPHKYAYCLAKVWQSSNKVLRLATCILNDVLVYLDLCISFPALALAAATIRVATSISEEQPVYLCEKEMGMLGLHSEDVIHLSSCIQGMLSSASV